MDHDYEWLIKIKLHLILKLVKVELKMSVKAYIQSIEKEINDLK